MSLSQQGHERAVADLQARLARDPDDLETLMALAVALRRLGRTEDAIACFRRALAAHPNVAEIWFNLGNAQSATGDAKAAAESYARALALKPDLGPAHFNLGNLLREKGDLAAAENAYRRALALMPEHAVLHMNLGNLLRRLDRLDEAIACHRRALALEPQRHEARFNLANALVATGERDEAARCYREVLAARPDFADAAVNLAALVLSDRASPEADELIAGLLVRDPQSRAALMLLGRRRIVEERWAEAEAALRRALAAGASDDAEAHQLHGLCLFRLGDAAGAVAAYQRSLAIAPDLAAALNGLGVALQALGDLGAASEALRAAARRRPEDSDILTNLGSVLVARGEVDEGIALLRKSTGLDPTDATAFSNLGHALFLIGHLGEAVAACEAAVRLQPGYVDAYSNLGTALANKGPLADARAAFQRALALDPEHGVSSFNLLYLGNYDPDMSSAALAELHRGLGRRLESVAPLRHDNDRDPGRKLRVGYVSPDFRQHSVAYFVEPLLAAHDPDAVEVTCYAAVKKRDDVTERLQSHAGAWRNILGMSDAAAADCIRADRIDILVDLAGHTAGNRLGIFARKPAPVQATYIGYPNTTGLTRMDYRLTDAQADPPGDHDSLYSEQLYRLPRCFLAYRPPPEAPPVAARSGWAAGYVTFGSFNALTKVNARTVAAWAAILHAVPSARLILKNASLVDLATQACYRDLFASHGIAAARVDLVAYVPDKGGHLGLYNRIDIALDTFPYNGTTTTCEALWMGVPVVTWRGECHAGRVGASLLAAVGLDELVAPSLEAYVALARYLAADFARLAAISRSLRGRLEASPLLDARSLARAVEAAYREMWQRWCRNGP
jgi:predicted O-linked N-acetylglucosamine transferase (SPINDLY family)